MTITNGYCTLAELRARIGNIDADNTDNDSMLENIIESSSRWIDWNRRRVFYKTTEERKFTPRFQDRIWIDDAIAITTVKVAINSGRTYSTWDSGDYDIFPANETPTVALYIAPDVGKYFIPGLRDSVKITADWGFSNGAPLNIKEACLLMSIYIWMRKDAPLGVSGISAIVGEMSSQPHMIPEDIRGMLYATPRRIRGM